MSARFLRFGNVNIVFLIKGKKGHIQLSVCESPNRVVVSIYSIVYHNRRLAMTGGRECGVRTDRLVELAAD